MEKERDDQFSWHDLNRQYSFTCDFQQIKQINLAPVVSRLDSTIHWINRYPADVC